MRPACFVFSLLLFAGCLEAPPADGELSCDPDQPGDCPSGFVCKPHFCPADYRCYRRQAGDRDYYPRGCVVDGVCDVETCETTWTCSDCNPVCDPGLVNTPVKEQLISLYIPDGEFGVDLDNDGSIDNKWGQIAELLDGLLPQQLQFEISDAIAAGELLIAARVFDDYPGESGVDTLVQLLLAEVHDATPVYEGNDVVRLAADASTGVGLCGREAEQRYGTPMPPDTLRFPVPWPGRNGTVEMSLHRYFLTGDLLSTPGWLEARLGGGISPAEVDEVLMPALAELMNRTIADDPQGVGAQIADVFDGNCVQLSQVPGCEQVVAGEGECDDSSDPPVITLTELRCNAIVHSALAPDIDSDGDGVDDLISFGVRLRAVPATIYEP